MTSLSTVFHMQFRYYKNKTITDTEKCISIGHEQAKELNKSLLGLAIPDQKYNTGIRYFYIVSAYR